MTASSHHDDWKEQADDPEVRLDGRVDPRREDAYWQGACWAEPYFRADCCYEDYAPAYCVGYIGYAQYGGCFEDAEKSLCANWLRIKGDSMEGAGILDGDWAIIDHGREARHGSIVAAFIDGKSTLKRFLLRQGKPYLKAENPRYPDLTPCEELMVQGVFVGLYRKAL